MDPESDLGLHCLLERLLNYFRRRQKQTTFVVIGLLRVNAERTNQERILENPVFV